MGGGEDGREGGKWEGGREFRKREGAVAQFNKATQLTRVWFARKDISRVHQGAAARARVKGTILLFQPE